jgi:hypothetical protein
MRWLLLATCVACSIDQSGLWVADAGPSPDVASDAVTKDASQDVVLEVRPMDAPPDVPPACNLTKPFGAAVNLGNGVNTGQAEIHPSLTSDELTIFFARDPGGSQPALWYATRSTTSQAFGTAVQATSTLPAVGAPDDTSPSVLDGLLTLYFESTRYPNGHAHIYAATGSGTPNGWSTAIELSLNINPDDFKSSVTPFWSAAAPELWLANDQFGTFDIYVSAGGTAAMTPVSAVNSAAQELHPTLTSDGLTLFFGRSDAGNKYQVWVAARTSLSSVMGAPQQVAELYVNGSDTLPGWVSVDGCRMYFTSNRPGSMNADIWMATRGS